MEKGLFSRSYQRTTEDVCKVIQHAKLDEKDLRSLSQALYFAEKFPEYRLLELDKELMSSLKEGDRIDFRGQRNDKAVLCTKDKTYEVKEAETSNSLLIIPDIKFAEDINCENGPRIIEEKQIIGIYYEYLEVKRTKPLLLKLKRLLQTKPFRGIELEEDDQSGDNYCTTEKLLENVQASEEELKEGLIEMGAFMFNGNWRILDLDYNFRALSYLLGLVDSNSWSLDQIPLGEVFEELNSLLPKPVLHHIIELYLEPADEYSDSGEEYFRLKEDDVCRLLGICLLKPVKKFNLNDFLNTWQDGVPEGMTTNLKQLGGVAVSSLDSQPPCIWFFPEDELSEDIQERFASLFESKERWTFEEIAPYIKRLSSEKQSINSLLTKYSRSLISEGVRYYTARHGK